MCSPAVCAPAGAAKPMQALTVPPRATSATAANLMTLMTCLVVCDIPMAPTCLLLGHDRVVFGGRVEMRVAGDVDDDPGYLEVRPERRVIAVADRGPDLVPARESATGVREGHGRAMRDVGCADRVAIEEELTPSCVLRRLG